MPINPDKCPLMGLLNKIVGLIRMPFAKNRFIAVCPDEIEGQWDCDGLRRVVENSCANAVKYGDEKSQVAVAVGRLSERRSFTSMP